MHNNSMLTGLVIVVVFVGGFIIGRMTSQAPLPTFMTSQNTSETANSDTSDTNSAQTSGGTNNASGLSEGQLKMLASFGIDPNSITPAMIACGEAKLGAERTAEIKNGATPSISEGISLMACYK